MCFLQVLLFPLTLLVSPTAPHSLLILLSALHNLDSDDVLKYPTIEELLTLAASLFKGYRRNLIGNKVSGE